MALRKASDFFSGICFFLTGVGAVLLSKDYPFGTLRSLGPGFFPLVLGSLLAVIGTILTIRSFYGEIVSMAIPRIRVAAMILGGSLLFGLLIRPAGLVVSIVVMVLAGAAASKELSVATAILTALILAAGSAVIFVYALGLPLPIVGALYSGR